MDGKSILLVENNNTEDIVSVVILDSLNLHKQHEYKVTVCNEKYTKHEGYSQFNDFNEPSEMETWKTDSLFPKYSCWNHGQSLMVGVGADPRSKVYYKFLIYNSFSRRITSEIKRTNKKYLSSLILEVKNDPHDEDKLVFITKEEETTYTVVEINVENSDEVKLCQIIGNDIELFKISQDVSTIYIAQLEKMEDNSQGISRLYALDWDTDYNFTEDSYPEPIWKWDSGIIKYEVVENAMLIVYSLADQTEKIIIFGKGFSEEIDWAFSCGYIGHLSIYKQYDKTQVIGIEACYSDQGGSPVVRFIEGKSKNKDEVSFVLSEIDHYRYSFPNYILVKGQREIISYNFQTKNYTYFITPAPIVLYHKDNKDTSCFLCLMDNGFEYVPAVFGVGVYNYQRKFFVLDISLKTIDKDKFTKADKFLNYLGIISMVTSIPETNEDIDESQHDRSSITEQFWVIHTTSHLIWDPFLYGEDVTYQEDVTYIDMKYDTDELFAFSYNFMSIRDRIKETTHLLFYKKGGDTITMTTDPINFSSRNAFHTIYDWNGTINKAVFCKRGYYGDFKIVDDSQCI